MISHANDKLGRRFWSFSLPIKDTCHWRTPTCDSVCYAQSGRFYFGSVQKKYAENLLMTVRPDFASLMALEIARSYVTHFRIHASGDFYSAAYVRNWIKIARRSPSVTFLAYTRAWQKKKKRPNLLPALRDFAELANVRLWLSTDRDTVEPPAGPWRGRAYLMMADDDVPPYPVELVFRNSRRTVLKRSAAGTIVCPPENGTHPKTKITCSSCGMCYAPAKVSPPGRVPLGLLETVDDERSHPAGEETVRRGVLADRRRPVPAPGLDSRAV